MPHKNYRTYKLIFLLILTISWGNEIKAEPSKNMHSIINDCVSVLDFLCYQLKSELYEVYQSPKFTERYSIQAYKHLGAKELSNYLDYYVAIIRPMYPSKVETNVYFDYGSNRLTVEISTQHLDYEDQYNMLEGFRKWWEEKNYEYNDGLSFMKSLDVIGYDVGKIESPKPRPPRYENFRYIIYHKVHNFNFHYGYLKANYDEKAVKKELIERLRIRIYFGNIRSDRLYREFYDGRWIETK